MRVPTDLEVIEWLKDSNTLTSLEEVSQTFLYHSKTPPKTEIAEETDVLQAFHTEIRPFVDHLLDVNEIRPPKIAYKTTNIDTGYLSLAALQTASVCPRDTTHTTRRQLIGFAALCSAIALSAGFGIRTVLESQRETTQIPIRKNQYKSEDEEVQLKEDSLEEVQLASAHEYTHHIQNVYGIEYKTHSLFCEGQARGVERQMASARGNKRMLEVFNAAYADDHISRPHLEIILQKGTVSATKGMDKLFWENRHMLGNILFTIAELKHGPGIYAEALRDPRVVLE